MNKEEIKDKLKNIIRELLLLDLKSDKEIPEIISNYFLENYGFANSQKLDSDQINSFVLRLHKHIGDKHLINDPSIKPGFFNVKFDCHKFLEAESEYSEVTMELVKLLEEVIKRKDTYSEYFKDKCRAQETSTGVLNKKCEFLKRQLFLKLYGEENALNGHLVLRDMLIQELENLRKEYNEVVELNKQYEELKDNEVYQELFKKYRELRKIEERTEIVNEIF